MHRLSASARWSFWARSSRETMSSEIVLTHKRCTTTSSRLASRFCVLLRRVPSD